MATGTGADYEALLAERDVKIAELEGAIAEAAKTAVAAETLRAKMDELRRQGEEQHAEFELTMAGSRNVKAARVLLDKHGGDVSKLKEAEPWLFSRALPPGRGQDWSSQRGGGVRRGQDDEAVARDRGHRGRGVTDGQQNRSGQELHDHP